MTQAGGLLALKLWFDERLVMLGDAAHAMSPYAGMSVYTAIGDAMDDIVTSMVRGQRPNSKHL